MNDEPAPRDTKSQPSSPPAPAGARKSDPKAGERLAAALREKPVFEYAPLRVKQAVVGAGRASKEQMARTVMALLGHGRTLALDEADAAGVALCHAFTWRE